MMFINAKMQTKKNMFFLLILMGVLCSIISLTPIAHKMYRLACVLRHHQLSLFWESFFKSAAFFSSLMFYTAAGLLLLNKKYAQKIVEFSVPCLFLLSSVIFWVIAVQSNDIWYDEMSTIHVASLPDSKSFFHRAIGDLQPPFHYLILRLPMLFSPENPVLAKVVSVIPVVLFMGIGSLFLYKHFSPCSAILLILLTSANTPVLYYSHEIRGYSWAFFMIGVTSVFLWHCITLKEKKWMAYFFVSVGITSLTHYYCMLAALVELFFLLLWYFLVNKALLKKILVAAAILLLLSSPIIYLLIGHIIRLRRVGFWIEPISFDLIKRCFDMLLDLDKNVVVSFGLVTSVLWGLSGLFFIKQFSVRGENSFYLISLYLIAPLTILGALVVSYLVTPLLYPRYLFPCSAVLILFLSITLPDFLPKTGQFIFVFIGLWLCMNNLTYSYKTEKTKAQNFNEYQSVLSENIDNQSTFIVFDFGETVVLHEMELLKYYYPDNNIQYEHFDDINNFEIAVEGVVFDGKRNFVLLIPDTIYEKDMLAGKQYSLLTPGEYRSSRYYFNMTKDQ